MKLTRVHSGFFNSSGHLSQWVLLDQCQAAVDAVECVGSDEGDVAAGENIKLDHFSGWETVSREWEASAFILAVFPFTPSLRGT